MSLRDEAIKLYGNAATEWSGLRTFIKMRPQLSALIGLAAGVVIGFVAKWAHFPF